MFTKKYKRGESVGKNQLFNIGKMIQNKTTTDPHKRMTSPSFQNLKKLSSWIKQE